MKPEDNQRIKRFKNVLEVSIQNADQIFVVAHDNPDLDAIASAIGVYTIIRNKFKKPCYIIVNDSNDKIEAGVKKVMDKEKGKIPFITLKKYLEIKSDNDLLITTDVNKKNRVSVINNLGDFKDIILIDHHGEDAFTIDVASEKKFITCNVSSASEIVTRLSCGFRSCFDENVATYLLAGIKLDTSNFSKNTDGDTMDMMKKLMKSGARNEEVQELFQENFESDVRVGELVKQTRFNMFQYAVAVATEEEHYSREELAKAADKILKYGVDAAFVIGYLDPDMTELGVSARSNGKIHVGHIMEELKGGGNPTAAATTSKEMSAEEMGKAISLKLTNPYETKKGE